jgi:hypothetical protein
MGQNIVREALSDEVHNQSRTWDENKQKGFFFTMKYL